nr:reverse transcriptase domain-containing protein [Tanacetum cinerariifolium]
MDSPTLFVSAKKNLGDPIEIRVDIVYPAPADVFPAAIVVRTLAQHGEAIRGIHGYLQGVPINEEINALRFRMGMAEEENAFLRGIVGLSQWVEKMELVFYISGCVVENHVKFATCTLLGAALTWWNGHVRTLGHDTA